MTPRRVAVVASEILGVAGTGGPGTADSFLAVALGRNGHDVELLVAPGRDVSRLSPEWESADAVVSPSEWLVGWLRNHGWPLPEPMLVVQNLWESVALGKPVQRAAENSPIRRLAFFGQVREGKGIRVFIESLRRLDPSLL